MRPSLRVPILSFRHTNLMKCSRARCWHPPSWEILDPPLWNAVEVEFQFTDYDPRTGVGTVAFKPVDEVREYKEDNDIWGSCHLVHYYMLHGTHPTGWKILTG